MPTIADLMTTEVFTIPATMTVSEAIALMQVHHLRSLIVQPSFEGDTYGILTERDIAYQVLAGSADPAKVLVEDVMRKPCISVSPDLSLQAAAQRFADTGIQRAPVIAKGQLVGIVSVTDMVMKLNLAQPNSDALSERIQEALLHARVACNEQEQVSQECAVAWDIVEELQAEAAHRRTP